MFKAQDLEGIGSGAWGFKVFGLWRCSDIDSGAWGLRIGLEAQRHIYINVNSWIGSWQPVVLSMDLI